MINRLHNFMDKVGTVQVQRGKFSRDISTFCERKQPNRNANDEKYNGMKNSYNALSTRPEKRISELDYRSVSRNYPK